MKKQKFPINLFLPYLGFYSAQAIFGTYLNLYLNDVGFSKTQMGMFTSLSTLLVLIAVSYTHLEYMAGKEQPRYEKLRDYFTGRLNAVAEARDQAFQTLMDARGEYARKYPNRNFSITRCV